MSNQTRTRTARPGLRELFDNSRRDRGEASALLSRIVQMIEIGAGVDETAALVGHLRLSRDPQCGKQLDQYLLDRIATFDRARRELETVHTELEARVQQLLSPPFFPSRYLGSVTTSRGEYASVLHGGSHRLVAFAEGLAPDNLSVGDEVYLCHEQNAAIEKAAQPRPLTGETAAIIRHTEDGRIVVADRDTELVVAVADELEAERLKPGDRVLWDRSAHVALGRLEPGGAHGFEDIDATPPQQLGGLDQLRDDVLMRFVFAIANPELARRYGVSDDGAQRLLLKGPPGTGKTTLMRIVASMIAAETRRRCRVVSIAGAELYSSYVGETERNIRRCFAVLNDYDGPGIAFFDEIDAVGRARGNVSGFHDDRFLGTLLAELEGMRRSDVAVIAATNRADVLDPALRGRFSWELEIPRPNRRAAKQIFGVHLSEHIPYRPNGSEAPDTRNALIDAGVSALYDPNADNGIASLQFRDGKHREVAVRDLISGRLIEQICGAARASAFERHCRGGEAGVAVADMRLAVANAIERLRTTLCKDNVASYLNDLPQDVDVVSVDTSRPRVSATAYLRS